ncbi:YfcZ/YiiS family protein [Klebsiella pneumoniae]|nr:YfcZ/YiiS family protein [Klebsiella pneumoniae]
MSKCSADETPVCCCMDVGTIVDNTDCTASYSRVFANRAEAEQTLAALSEKARNVESEPCQINPTFTDVDGGVQLDIDFLFTVFWLAILRFSDWLNVKN